MSSHKRLALMFALICGVLIGCTADNIASDTISPEQPATARGSMNGSGSPGSTVREEDRAAMASELLRRGIPAEEAERLTGKGPPDPGWDEAMRLYFDMTAISKATREAYWAYGYEQARTAEVKHICHVDLDLTDADRANGYTAARCYRYSYIYQSTAEEDMPWAQEYSNARVVVVGPRPSYETSIADLGTCSPDCDER